MGRRFHVLLFFFALALGGCRAAGPMVTPGGVGTPCSGDDACALGLTCRSLVSVVDLGSICTRTCRVDEDCPSPSRCGPSDATASGYVWSCLPACDRTLDVSVACAGTSSEYACEYDGVCTIFRCSDALCDSGRCDARTGDCISGANPSARVDDPCTSDADCRPPRGQCLAGRCQETDCDRGGEYACAAGETCTATAIDDVADVLAYSCARACTPGVDATSAHAGGSCLDGQICVPPEADPGGLSTTGSCAWFNNGHFVTGNAAAHVGDPCTRDDDCPSPLGYGLCDGGHCALRFCGTSAFTSDPCGPNERCLVVPLPATQTRFHQAAARAGMCVVPCDTRSCPTGQVCRMAEGICQVDCRIDPSVCPATTRCAVDGTCT